MTLEDILKIKDYKNQGCTVKQTQKLMPQYTACQIKHLYGKLFHDNENNIEKISELASDNQYSASEIDKILSLPKGTSALLCRIHNIIVKTKTLSYSQHEIDIVKQYYSEYGVQYVSDLLKISPTRAYTLARHLNLKRNYQYSEELENSITEDYKNGLTPYELGIKYNRSTHAIENFLSRRNLNNIHNVNSQYCLRQVLLSLGSSYGNMR